MTKHPIYSVWSGMRDRCLDRKNKHYADYGGCGIRICKRWDNFENFLIDMGERPHGMTLERKNNDGNYEPNNCIWATYTQQARNKRKTRRITIDGTTLSLSEWCEKMRVPYDRTLQRISSGWDPVLALKAKARTFQRCVLRGK